MDRQVSLVADCLRERLAEYYEIGASFAKWRAVINIGENLPTTLPGLREERSGEDEGGKF